MNKKDDRNYKLDNLKYALENFEKISIDGDYGVGKTHLLTSLEEDLTKQNPTKYKFIKINANDSNGTPTEMFVNALKSQLKISFPIVEKYKFGKFITNWSNLAFAILIPTITAFITLFGIFYKDSTTTMIVIFVTLLIFFVVVLLLFGVFKYKINKYDQIAVKKFSTLKNKKFIDLEKVIFVVDNLSRIDIDKQLVFFNEMNESFNNFKISHQNSFKKKENSLITKNIIYIFDSYQIDREHDLSKFIDYNIHLINDPETIFHLTLEILGDENEKFNNPKIIKSLLKDEKVKWVAGNKLSYLDFMSSLKIENIRKIRGFLKKLDYYTENKEFIKVVNTEDLMDYLILELVDSPLFQEIYRSPNLIFNNSLYEDHNQAISSEFAKRLLNFSEKNGQEVSGFKLHLKSFQPTIFRKQKLANYTNYNLENDDQSNKLRVTNASDYYFFKYPNRFKDLYEIIENFIKKINDSNQTNLDDYLNFFNDNRLKLDEFVGLIDKMTIELISTFNPKKILNKDNYKNVMKQILAWLYKPKKTTLKDYKSETWYLIVKHFLEKFNVYVVKQMLNLIEKSQNDSLTFEDYEFIKFIASELKSTNNDRDWYDNVEWYKILDLDKKDKNSPETKDMIANKKSIINNFYSQYELNEITDDFLDKIWLVSNDNVEQFVNNLTALDISETIVLVNASINSEKYSERIEVFLNSINKDNEIIKNLKTKNSLLYKEVKDSENVDHKNLVFKKFFDTFSKIFN